MKAWFSLVMMAVMAMGAMVHAEDLPVPPQDQGLPYTRSAQKFALEKIKDHIALFPGSRYAYVKGHKIRLDNINWTAEAILRDGHLFVPAPFAPVLAATTFTFDTAPAYLADRWVYTIQNLPPAPANSDKYLPITAPNQKIYQHPRGLVLIGEKEITFTPAEQTLLDSVITLFDTPEKFADPDIATQYIPSLARQGKWTAHAKVTPEQLARLYGPETPWPTAPRSQYDLTGFNTSLLGSPVPPPGVYPRILFSPQDVPALAQRIQSTKPGQMALIEMEHLFKKSWWDPTTSDGQIFLKLASGNLADLNFDLPPNTSPTACPQTFKGQKPGITNSHVAYVPECLTAMSLYCLLTSDDLHGRQAAAAIANWYKLREPLIDEVNSITDSEYGSSYTRPDGSVVPMNGGGGVTHWRSLHGLVANMNLGLSLDFAGKWMTPAEKDLMRRVIAKATYGRRPYGQDGPIRFRDINWVTWDLPHFLALAAIEGLEGFDREPWDSNRLTTRAFCDWGIDPSGVIYESNGKTPGGTQFQLLSMITLARRGENLFAHPHFRKLLEAQIQMTSPSGQVVVNSGTQYVSFSRQHFSFQVLDELKAFFPSDRKADYLLSLGKIIAPAGDEGMREWLFDDFSPDTFRRQVAKLLRLRLPSLTYPGFVHGVLYDADFQPTTRADLNLPLDFNAPVHGVFSSYSDPSPQAAWINMMVRPNHYLGAGHHHADAGMIHFSALGIDWFTESPFPQTYDGKYHNQVLVDGVSEPENMPGFANGYQAAATYLGATLNPAGSFASADLTNAYSYRWLTQPNQLWPEPINSLGWEMDPSEHIQSLFAGTARYKMRPWWSSYTYSNYIPTCRAPFNPMQYVYRTAGLLRGPHPYALIIDDLQKDSKPHLYQWTTMLNGGVRQAKLPSLPPNHFALAFRPPQSSASPITPENNEPLLLVVSLDPDPIQIQTAQGPPERQSPPKPYDRLTIDRTSITANYKILLIPIRANQPLPQITYDPATSLARIQWPDQSDELHFTPAPDHRTHFTLTRNQKPLLSVN